MCALLVLNGFGLCTFIPAAYVKDSLMDICTYTEVGVVGMEAQYGSKLCVIVLSNGEPNLINVLAWRAPFVATMSTRQSGALTVGEIVSVVYALVLKPLRNFICKTCTSRTVCTTSFGYT